MLSLSSSEMLALWRRALGFETLRTDCSVEAVEGIDIDAAISLRMRQWYLDLLDSADPDLLPVSDIAPQASLSQPQNDGSAIICLPENARRVLSLRLNRWMRYASPRTPDSVSDILALMASPYGRPGIYSPLAVLLPHALMVAPAQSDSIASLLAVIDPGPESYILDESLLALIPKTLKP